MRINVYVGLGSNVDRETHLRRAVDELHRIFGELQRSPVYDSKSVGFEGDNFLNMVVGFESDREVGSIVGELHAIEDRLGRDRNKPRFSNRIIDLDILLYGDRVIDLPGIQIPRREITINAFVLRPLQDLAPGSLHPELKQSYSVLWSRMAAGNQTLSLFPLEFELPEC